LLHHRFKFPRFGNNIGNIHFIAYCGGIGDKPVEQRDRSDCIQCEVVKCCGKCLQPVIIGRFVPCSGDLDKIDRRIRAADASSLLMLDR
jgi:hypothetical protein